MKESHVWVALVLVIGLVTHVSVESRKQRVLEATYSELVNKLESCEALKQQPCKLVAE